MKSSIILMICNFLSELLATGIVVFLGCMGCIQYGTIQNSHLQMILNFGFVIVIVVQVFGCVSGSHINPAITIAAYIYKRVSAVMACCYMAGQMIGGTLGFGLLIAVVPKEAIHPTNSTGPGLCTTVPRADLHILQAVAIEYLATVILIFVCCGIWDPRNSKYHDSVAVRFGLAVAALACSAGPFTGASMNPARSFGPALWNWHFKHHWIYWIGPLAAGVTTSYFYRYVFYREVKPETPDEIPVAVTTK